MIRCCSKFSIPFSSSSSGQLCLNRIYVASSSRDFNQKRYASGQSKPPRRFRKIFFTTVGVTLVGVGGIVVYAKSDPKFRKVLDSYIPGSDQFIRIIYQEDGLDFVGQLSSFQDKVLSIPSDILKQISGTSSDTTPSILPKAKELTSEETAKPKPKPAVDTSRKPIALVKVSDSEVKSLGDEAIKSYNEIAKTIHDKADEVITAIDKIDDSPDPSKAWKEVRGKMDEIKKTSQDVEKKLAEAGEKVKNFTKALKKLPDATSTDMKTLEANVNKAKEEAEDLFQEKLKASAKYISKVDEFLGRNYEELQILFPNYKPGAKTVKLSDHDVDLFLYYAYHKLVYYQKELEKTDKVIQQKLDKVVKSKDDSQKIAAAVAAKVEEAKRQFKGEYDKKMLELKKGCEDDVKSALKRQEQVHMDILNEQLAQKEKEVQRKLKQKMNDKLVEEQAKYQAELADMTGRMQGLNEAISKRALQDHKAQNSQALWSAAQALYDNLKHGEGDKVKPMKEYIDAVNNASAKGDDLVETVMATIPPIAVKRGVYPEDALRTRFKKVEQVAWKVAGVPEGGASLPKLFIAWLQSLLVLKASEPVPPGEQNNEPFDAKSLTNYDILQRAKYYVDKSDFVQAVRYMNLLRGGAWAVSSDWIKEAVVLLETEQAAQLLLAHASAAGMVYS